MPATTDPSDNSGGRHQKTRLETEIDEILERTERTNPLPPPTRIRTKSRQPRAEHAERVRNAAGTFRQWLVAVPLVVSYMFAILAHLISGVSPFLTHLVVNAAIIALFWPIFESFRERHTTTSSTVMWRGREMERAPSTTPSTPSPWQQFRQWLRNRRLLP